MSRASSKRQLVRPSTPHRIAAAPAIRIAIGVFRGRVTRLSVCRARKSRGCAARRAHAQARRERLIYAEHGAPSGPQTLPIHANFNGFAPAARYYSQPETPAAKLLNRE